MSKKVLVAVLVGIIIVVGLGLMVYRTPHRMVTTALENFSEQNAQAFDATLEMQNKGGAGTLSDFSKVALNLNGVFQEQEGQTPAIASTFKVQAQGEGISIEVMGQTRLVDDRMYFYLETVPNVPPGIDQFKGKWFSLARGTRTAEAPTVTSDFQGLAYKGRETVAGSTTYKYEGTMGNDMVIDIVESIVYFLGNDLTDQHVNQLKTNLQGKSGLPVAFWVTPWSQQLRRFDTVLKADAANAMNVSVVFSESADEVPITVPEGAIALDQLAPAANPQASPVPQQ